MRCIGVVGCTLSKTTGKQSYGGREFIKKKYNYVTGTLISPSENEFLECDLANWNCFLLDSEVVETVGLIDPIYEHSLGDFDYSLRMRMHNIYIMIARKYIGLCDNNGIANTFRDPELPVSKRWKLMLSPNGFPVYSWYYYTKKYYGKFWVRNFIAPYVRSILSFITYKKC